MNVRAIMDFIEFKEKDIIENSIEIIGIQEGGLGRVYFGYCRNRKIKVVIKTFLKTIWEKYDLAEKWPEVKNDLIEARLPSRSIDIGEYLFFTFFREARLVCQSRNHPNVIKGTRFWWMDTGQPFYECEFVRKSRDLGEFYNETIKKSGLRRLSVLEVAHIAISFCNGMIYVSDEMIEQYNRNHKDDPATLFVHRDIKPENIMIDNRNIIKIIDMGLSKFHLSRTTTFFVDFPLHGGAPKYMAPEQSISYESAMPSSDIYSFGATMYEMFGGDSFSIYTTSRSEDDINRIEDIPHEFHQILSTCLRTDMTKRYQNFRQLKKALVQFITDVEKGKIRINENMRCEKCGYISPEFQASAAVIDTKQIEGPNNHKMARVPAGNFFKGCGDEHKKLLTRKLGTSGGLGKEEYKEVFLDAFEIDICEVTNLQYFEFARDTGHPFPRHWGGELEALYPFPRTQENFPVVNVSYDDAQAYCEWAGLRLPTGDEWEKAARGTDGRLYPWGDEYISTLCNSAESRNRGPVAVDQYPEGSSPYGCFQMVGNVMEWVDESHPKSDNYRYLRGGCWSISCEVLGPPFMHYIASPKSSTGASRQKDIFGFRCARDAKGTSKSDSMPIEDGTMETCPLCGGEFVAFDLKEIKVPEKNIYTWFGYFDVE